MTRHEDGPHATFGRGRHRLPEVLVDPGSVDLEAFPDLKEQEANYNKALH